MLYTYIWYSYEDLVVFYTLGSSAVNFCPVRTFKLVQTEGYSNPFDMIRFHDCFLLMSQRKELCLLSVVLIFSAI